MKVYPKNLEEVMEWDRLNHRFGLNLSIIMPFEVGMFSHKTGKMIYAAPKSNEEEEQEAPEQNQGPEDSQ